MIRERIYQQMLKRGVNQATLCNDLGFHQSNFNAFLRGNRTLTYSNLVSILKYLKLSIGIKSVGIATIPPEDMSVVFRNRIACGEVKLAAIEASTGICQSSLSSIVTGKRTASTKNLEKLLAALGLDVLPYKK